MNCLQRIPYIHRNQPMIKVAFDFDTGLLGLANPQKGGTALRHIQELLGRRSSKTAELYTHVRKKSLANIKSPLDYIIDSQKTDNEHITKLKT
jgi:hypothetical protein